MAEPYYRDEDVTLHLGDCLDVLAAMEPGSIDAVVTDPPYALGFMGKTWDSPGSFVERPANREHRWDHVGGNHNPVDSADAARTRRVEGQRFQAWCQQWAAECLRVLKPGGHLLAFGGTRTWHRLVCGIEDAGFEVRDAVADLTGYDAAGLMWVYGSGFPKSLDVSKAIDKAAGAQREVVGKYRVPADSDAGNAGKVIRSVTAESMFGISAGREGTDITAPATEDAARWEGWGTALKPGWEPIAVGRKPLAGTVAGNVLEYGTGALNIDGCRVEGGARPLIQNAGGKQLDACYGSGKSGSRNLGETDAGRWPPNVVLGPAAAAELDRQSGVLTSGANPARRGSDKFRDAYGEFAGQEDCTVHRGVDSGGASRFFPVFRYEAKAPASERPRAEDGTAHPTVKPVDLMRWLVRLVTPPDGLVLDPFAGSGTTAEACIIEGFRCILIEQAPKSAELIVKRLSKPIQPVMFGLEGA